MEKIKQEVIKKIRDNKISSTEIADVLGKKGHVKGPLPLNEGMHQVGEVSFIYAYNESNWEVHEQAQNIESGKIVYVHGIECGEKAIFGDLVSKYLILYKQAKAIVVSGFMRDCHTILKEKYPVWASGRTPIGCNNIKNTSLPSSELLNELKDKYDGGIMVCDDSGVVLIEKHQINEELLKKLDFIELQEDVWFFCMDTHKMSTYEIVCEKKYLNENEGLVSPKKLADLSAFSTEK